MKIIAEFCQNHNGDKRILEEMIAIVNEIGVSHAKIQNIYADNLTYRPQFENGIEINGEVLSIKRPYEQEYNRLKKLELNNDLVNLFVEKCEEVIPMTTCFFRSDIQNIINQGFKSVKVASYDCGSHSMINELKGNFNEIIISTGASFDDEIIKTAKILNGSNFTFLHAITKYPTELKDMHLNRMNFLSSFTNNFGFSDHTNSIINGNLSSMVAIYIGAKCIERHFTILPKDNTRDGKVSVNPEELIELLNFSKLNKEQQLEIILSKSNNWKILLGDMKRTLSKEELLNRDYYRGRFASIRNDNDKSHMVYNYES